MKTETFGIEHGELNHVQPATAFVLGVEWLMFRDRLLTGEPFHEAINTLNLERCTAMCDRHGRFNESWPVDEMPGWHIIIVGGYKCEK